MRTFFLIIGLLTISLSVFSQGLEKDEYYTLFSSIPPDKIKTDEKMVITLGYVQYSNDTIFTSIAFMADEVEHFTEAFQVVKVNNKHVEEYGKVVEYICLNEDDVKIIISNFKQKQFNLLSIIIDAYDFNTTIVIE
ncbi:MAG: hypothetical protein R6U85_09685 [Salinivirgaceae bacterium]